MKQAEVKPRNGFFQLWNEAYDLLNEASQPGGPLTSFDFKVWIAVASHRKLDAKTDGGRCYSVFFLKGLAKHLHVSQRTIKRSVHRLEKAKFLILKPDRTGNRIDRIKFKVPFKFI